MDCWLWVLIWDVMHTWQASIYFYFFTCIFSDAEWNHTHKEKKREMPHFLNSIFHEFLILPVLSFSRYSRQARSSSLVFHALSSLSHCSHTCCPSSHNLIPSLEPFVLFLSYPVFLFLYREYQHSIRKQTFTLLLTALSIMRKGLCSFLRECPAQLL